MKILWTKRKGYKIDYIRKFLGDDCSHVMIYWDSNQYVSHWTSKGYKYESKSVALKSRSIVHMLSYDVESNMELNAIKRLDNLDKDRYDWSYFRWLTLMAMRRLIFRIKIPYGQRFDNPNSLICNEAIEELPESIRPKYDPYKANTPHRLYEELKGVNK